MKIKINKTEQRFKTIEVREPLVEDLIEAQKHEDDIEATAALMAQICTFDGKTLTMEDVRKMPVPDFLELQGELISAGFLGSKEMLSHLLGTADSDTKA